MLKILSFFVLIFVMGFVMFASNKILKKYDEVIRILVAIIVDAILFACYSTFLIPIL